VPGGSRGLPAQAERARIGLSTGGLTSSATCTWIDPSREPCSSGSEHLFSVFSYHGETIQGQTPRRGPSIEATTSRRLIACAGAPRDLIRTGNNLLAAAGQDAAAGPGGPACPGDQKRHLARTLRGSHRLTGGEFGSSARLARLRRASPRKPGSPSALASSTLILPLEIRTLNTTRDRERNRTKQLSF